MYLNLDIAHSAISAAHSRASERGSPSAIAIVDAGGNLFAFSANERAILAARELAIGKAYTSVVLRTDTSELDTSVQPGGEFFGLNNALSSRSIVTFAGGRPIFADDSTDSLLGGVGVSGGTLEDDADISLAAISSIKRSLSRDNI